MNSICTLFVIITCSCELFQSQKSSQNFKLQYFLHQTSKWQGFLFFQNVKTCFCLPSIKIFRQQTMHSDQNIKNKTLLKITKKFLIQWQKTNQTTDVIIFRTISTKWNGLLCCGDLSWLVNTSTIQKLPSYLKILERMKYMHIASIHFQDTSLKRCKLKLHTLRDKLHT